jgi:hypothetical protein
MKLQQVSVFLENRPGRLGQPVEALAAEGINILTLSLADTADFGILRLIVQEPERAKAVLEQAGCVVGLTDVVAVGVHHRSGGLAEVLRVTEAAGLAIEYTYAFALSHEDKAVLVIRFEDPDRAIQVLRDGGQHLIDADELLRLVD